MKKPIYLDMQLNIFRPPINIIGTDSLRWPSAFWLGRDDRDIPVYLVTPQFFCWLRHRLTELPRDAALTMNKRLTALRTELLDNFNSSEHEAALAQEKPLPPQKPARLPVCPVLEQGQAILGWMFIARTPPVPSLVKIIKEAQASNPTPKEARAEFAYYPAWDMRSEERMIAYINRQLKSRKPVPSLVLQRHHERVRRVMAWKAKLALEQRAREARLQDAPLVPTMGQHMLYDKHDQPVPLPPRRNGPPARPQRFKSRIIRRPEPRRKK
jgi:hypothetical protein